jgi:biotin transport system substrate-specific component
MAAAPSVLNIKALVRCAIFAALIAALGLLPPIPVPVLPVAITAQTLGVMLAGIILGPVRGMLAVILFIAVVALGFPVLAGGRGGLGVLFAPSAGFLFGWVLGVFVVGLITQNTVSFARFIAGCLIGGIGGIYLIGVPWTAWAADLTLAQAAVAALAFVPGDILKAIAAAWIARATLRGYPSLRQ